MIRLAILGATGMAGRDAVRHQLHLDEIGKQYAELTCVTASEESAGKRLGEVFDAKEEALSRAYPFWQKDLCPERYMQLVVDQTDPELIAKKADYAISALGSDIADTVEPALRRLGVHVFSNASTSRWDPSVPLMIPEVNHRDISMLAQQETPGKQICNPNCTTAGYTPILKAWEKFGIDSVSLVTYQAMSGKGDAIAESDYSSRITGNVRDDWTKNGMNMEEWKSSSEPMKILGKVRDIHEMNQAREMIVHGKRSSIIPIYSQTARVPTQYGHLESIFVDFKDDVDLSRLKTALCSFEMPPSVKGLPSTPRKLFTVIERMPEPRIDSFNEDGMSVVVGDMVQHTPRKVSLWSLTHNLRRGATWAGRQGLELYLATYK